MAISFAGLVKQSVSSFIEDDALSRGASIAFYVVTSIVPVLIIVISIAGAAFGEDAARGAIAAQLSDVMGTEGAELLQATIRGAAEASAGIVASMIGVITLLIASSGVFSEIQSALNMIWREPPKRGTIARLIRGRIASLGLVVALGVILMLSLAASAALVAPDAYINAHMPFGKAVLLTLNFALGFVLTTILFAAIYKILPDTDLHWHDVLFGAITTSVLFGFGKFLIELYIQSSAITSTYGAAGGLVALLLWIYYSAQIFLFGAEFTKAYTSRHGSKRGRADLVPGGATVIPGCRGSQPRDTVSH